MFGLPNGSRRTLIDAELYIPEDWTNDQYRREKCGIPEDLKFKTKAEDEPRVGSWSAIQSGIDI